jgi:rhomboid protease GluP
MSSSPESEVRAVTLPDHASGVERAPNVARKRRREFSEWDPRSAPGTYLLLTINILVFLWMVVHSVSWHTPTPDQLIHYGANNPARVLTGQWWRLLTATFVHIGIIHIATNMWCLWNLGLLGEPLIGPFGIIAVYVLTGVAGNLLSLAGNVLWPHSVQDLILSVGAGASGAVFGIAGLLIVLLSNRRLPIPWTELARLRRSVVQFAGINLVIGLSTTLPLLGNFVRIDNSAHVGGFLCGLALGPGLVPKMTAGKDRYLARQRVVFVLAAFVLSLVGYWLARFSPA